MLLYKTAWINNKVTYVSKWLTSTIVKNNLKYIPIFYSNYLTYVIIKNNILKIT
jgi:hypothetical protein